MLRFDLPPVWSNVTRWEAFIAFLVCGASLLFTPWLMLILVVQGLIRGFFGHYKCPSHRLWAWMFEARNWGGKKENAGAKMFANKVLFIASSITVILYMVGSDIWRIPTTMLMLFTTLEWAFSLCVACSVYGLWYSKFPPKST